MSVAQAINDLQSDNEPFHDKLGGMYGHLLPLVPEGLNYAYFTAEMNYSGARFSDGGQNFTICFIKLIEIRLAVH